MKKFYEELYGYAMDRTKFFILHVDIHLPYKPVKIGIFCIDVDIIPVNSICPPVKKITINDAGQDGKCGQKKKYPFFING
jgi:hypothetical protein